MDDTPSNDAGIASPSFGTVVRTFTRVGLQSFGGPAGQIAVMHRILVEEKRWIGERRFLHALNYCVLLPGPEAQQLATYLGWLLHGHRGGLAAGTLFVLPGVVTILAASFLYAAARDVSWVAGLFFGLKAAVLAVVVEAVLRIGTRVMKNAVMVAIAAAAFVGLFFFQVPFPAVVGLAALVGLVGSLAAPATFDVGRGPEAGESGPALVDALLARDPERTRPSLARAARVTVICLALWFAPIAVLATVFGRHHVFVVEAVFFSKAAAVTFGGAYAVLVYVAQQAVERYAWLGPGEMLDGLGLAETTPGPLVMVVQFVGFMGAFNHPGSLDPYVAGTIGALLTTWVTFVPCFLWIFLGAPWVEWLRGRRALAAALSAITAAVVGVISNLAAWFALHVLFTRVESVTGPVGLRLLLPDWTSVEPVALVVAVSALVAMRRFRLEMLPVLGASALVGLVARLLRG